MVEHLKDLAYVIGVVVTFIVGRKSTKITDKSGEIDNLSKYQLMYERFVSQYTQQYDTVQTVVEALRKEVRNLELRNAIIIEESETWKKRFNNLQSLYDKLKEEFENYKMKHK